MSDTPRTDASFAKWCANGMVANITNEMAQLERELAELQSKYRMHHDEAERMTRELADMQNRCQTAINLYETAAMRAGELEEQRDTLADALKYTVKRVGEFERPWRKRWDEVMVVVNKALAAVRGVAS